MNDYQLKQGDKIYVFSTCLVKNAVRLSCKNAAGKEYSRDFSVFDINSIDPIFSEIKSEQEAIQFIDKALGVHKVGVSEEIGLVKIIFYVTTKGVINTVSIPLDEKPSKNANANANESNTLASTAQAVESTQPVEIAPQTYENTNYAEPVNTYGQYSFYNVPNVTPIVEYPTDDSTFNNNNFMSQFQSGGATYTSFQGDAGFGATNIENVGSYILQDNNQFLGSNFVSTNGSTDFGGMNSYSGNYISGNEYNNNNIFDFSNNQYTSTDNNYLTSSYGNNYGTTYNYDQYGTTTSYNGQEYNVLPTITAADPISSMNPSLNINTFEGQFTTNTYPLTATYNQSQIQTTESIIPNQSQQPVYATQYVPDTTQEEDIPTDNVPKPGKNEENEEEENEENEENEEKNEKQPSEKENDVEKNPASLQKKSSKTQSNIDEEELEKLRAKAAEADALKVQLAQLEPLRRQLPQFEALKSQVNEIPSLRAQVAEYNSLKAQFGEFNILKQKLNHMNELEKQVEEFQNNKNNDEEVEDLKKKIESLEKIKLDYEQEIKELRESKNLNASSSNKKSLVANESKGLESRQILFEDKPKQVCVKGDIIHDTKELEMITRKINKFNKKLTLNLLYKASADTDKAAAFHGKCDDAKSTIVLVETDKGKRFGGYTTCSWRGDCIDKKDEDAFVFSFDTMKTYDNIPGEEAIGCYPKFGPIFLGCQIRIYDNAFSKGGTTFEKGLNYNTEEDYELTGGERAFNVKEIEVYEVIPQ